jgi:hypothetical protein
VEVSELAPGLWRWTGRHEEWGQDVGCVYLETDEEICLIDPLVPPEDSAHFLAALDRDAVRFPGRVHILVTVFWHARSARELVEHYDARLWVPARARAAVERRAGPVSDPFRPGDALPGGIQAFASGRRNEVLYWLPAHRTLVPGDVILGSDEGGVRLCPESWLPKGTTRATLAKGLEPLLALDVERILVSHGEPVLEGGRAAIAAALAV